MVPRLTPRSGQVIHVVHLFLRARMLLTHARCVACFISASYPFLFPLPFRHKPGPRTLDVYRKIARPILMDRPQTNDGLSLPLDHTETIGVLALRCLQMYSDAAVPCPRLRQHSVLLLVWGFEFWVERHNGGKRQ